MGLFEWRDLAVILGNSNAFTCVPIYFSTPDSYIKLERANSQLFMPLYLQLTRLKQLYLFSLPTKVSNHIPHDMQKGRACLDSLKFSLLKRIDASIY